LKVAITQTTIGGGGRLAVILEMIGVLNELNIEPDILTLKMYLSKKDIEKKYQRSLKFRIIKVFPNIFKKLPETNILFFNLLTRIYRNKYDLFIDSSNTSCFMSNQTKILSFIYYPRIDRVLKGKSIHNIDEAKIKLKTRFAIWLDHTFSRALYKNHKIGSNINLVTISEFSKKVVIDRYQDYRNKISIIYPPIELDSFKNNSSKNNWVSTLGRFGPPKKQLEQIEIAQKIPELEFHIMGFADTNSKYYKDLEKHVLENKVTNVKLHPNLDFSKMIEILGKSKFFLHTIWNEPFGITTVQGIAAGCIPVVPNSGGQIEVVPQDNLRFNDYDEAVEILRDQMKISNSNQKDTLLKHIQKFDTINFRKNFRQVIEEYTNGEKNAH